MSRRQALVLAVLLPAVLALSLIGTRLLGDSDHASSPELVVADSDQAFDYHFEIEPGTADRIAAGETVEIVPRQLDVRVGESIRIVNRDDANHSVGLFYVAAGQTLTQTFQSPGVLEGTCTVHPSGQFTLNVTE